MIVLMETGSTQEETARAKKEIRERNLGSAFREDGERVLIHVLADVPGCKPRVIEVLSGKEPTIIDEQRIPFENLC